MRTEVQPAKAALNVGSVVQVFALALVIAALSEWLGPLPISLGVGKVVLLPMIWALLIGLVLGLLRKRMPGPLQLSLYSQNLAAAVLSCALFLFIAKLGLLVGGSLPKLAEVGWGLVLQELGNLVGCVALGMPVALLLGIKREAIGATFSIGREPGLAIIGERFGMDSPEGRGVLAEYITGTLIGAIFISLLAGFVSSLNIFHPLALGMGAGVGSGSMTAAAVGAIAAQHPEMSDQIATFAAAANLIATTVGTYLTLFISLPLALRAYQWLEPILGRKRKQAVVEQAVDLSASKDEEQAQVPALGLGMRFASWVLVGAMVLIGNRIGHGVPVMDALPGVLLIIAAVFVGDLIYVGTRRMLPAVCWISFIAMAMTFPLTPYAAEVAALTGKVNFLAMITPMLTFAGLSLAKDIPAFRRLGWRIVVVSLLANAGVFLAATLIAQTFVHTL
ncbi:DUF3100 domain-containing protein [Comamonas thiooxydans]|uniref:AbgT transporter n=1 Tax=Comamonas thiooxydans TaxID=363952 RepID=A0A0E3BS83_9BURK|nr:DUF3100 domain-containing protein [Comamonas thiooxydans]KGH08773.1 AbgT transporter [Comamonas thiooxydans]KGH20269.1 AbgT transporter [Comamonas thiooxydans]KGH23694.1 AbgT transporter [Comamonas thiooxydans]